MTGPGKAKFGPVSPGQTYKPTTVFAANLCVCYQNLR
ncbi:uncharacterized protein METZ01_LOCUS256945, partial [marine metagenome]